MNTFMFTTIVVLQFISDSVAAICDLEFFFKEKRVSIENAALKFPIVFRGVGLATLEPLSENGVFTARFELLNTFKEVPAFRDLLDRSGEANNRRLNVTIMEKPTAECEEGIAIPQEYIVFGVAEGGRVVAASVTKWNERTDQRVWTSLGWGAWSDWSSCSVSCSSGIQQRIRHCLSKKCFGFNVEQRHCNIFGCNKTINPLTLEDGTYFHPSKDQWTYVPDRPTAWRLEPFTYFWMPSVLLLTGLNVTEFPKRFSVAFTVRLMNYTTGGTILSLRSRTQQNTYFSIDVRQMDLKLAHATENGSDTLIIPLNLADSQWHQIAISVREGNIVECFVDCEWSVTNILKATTFDLPEDTDLIIGYLFSGDVEQVAVLIDSDLAHQHCSRSRIPITDPSMEIT